MCMIFFLLAEAQLQSLSGVLQLTLFNMNSQFNFFYKIVLICRTIKDAVAQTSEIITYEANVQSIYKVDQEVSDELAYNIFNF